MKLICGPMATISHPAFRILIEKFGYCDEYFTEMINAGTLVKNGPFEKYYIDPTPDPKKIVWQLTGRTGQQMADASKILIQLPGIGMDINMGCSAPDIYRYGAGIAWMTKPREETYEMVKEVGRLFEEYNHDKAESDKKRLSVKLRLGDEDFTDEGFFEFCNQLADYGVQLFTLHPRTKKEKLIRPARYEYCQKLAEMMHKKGVKVYLNGNVTDGNSMKNALNKAPSVDGVMISRAAVQKPWIFRQLRCEMDNISLEPLTVDMQQLAFDYIDDVEKYQPEEFWKTRLQRFCTYFSMNFLFSHFAQTEFINAKSNEDLKQRIRDFFIKCPNERFKTI